MTLDAVQTDHLSEGGAGGYDGLLAVGDRIEGVVPDLLGGGNLRAFYRVDERLGLLGSETVLDLACGPSSSAAANISSSSWIASFSSSPRSIP